MIGDRVAGMIGVGLTAGLGFRNRLAIIAGFKRRRRVEVNRIFGGWLEPVTFLRNDMQQNGAVNLANHEGARLRVLGIVG